jgi:hypothetical protein
MGYSFYIKKQEEDRCHAWMQTTAVAMRKEFNRYD